MKVRDVMKVQVYTCSEGDTLNEAVNQMWQHDVGSLPVLDHAGRVVGMVTDRDIALAAFMTGKSLARIPVAEAMSKALYSCMAEQPVEEAEKAMRDHQVRRLPVTEESGQLTGVIALSDLARVARLSPELPCVDVVQTLSTITKPRLPSFAKA